MPIGTAWNLVGVVIGIVVVVMFANDLFRLLARGATAKFQSEREPFSSATEPTFEKALSFIVAKDDFETAINLRTKNRAKRKLQLTYFRDRELFSFPSRNRVPRNLDELTKLLLRQTYPVTKCFQV